MPVLKMGNKASLRHLTDRPSENAMHGSIQFLLYKSFLAHKAFDASEESVS